MSSRASDWLAWFAARLGWPGLAGIALLLAALAVQHAATAALAGDNVRLQGEIGRLEAQRAKAVSRAPTVAERLPGSGRTPEAVGRLLAAAGAAGLNLGQGEYKLQGGAGLRQYQIVLPVEGDYPALRAFLAEAMNRNPALTLDSLSLTRESVERTDLRAVLRFTLYLTAGQGT